jgi:hypothetical protein
MKKLFLSTIGMYLTLLSAFSQGKTETDSAYKMRKLTFEEASIVTSYYAQNGTHAAVTGGIGSEKLSDLSTSFELKYRKYDRTGRKHSFTGELGIDHYTSASSDKIDPYTISSASHADTRIYPSFQWLMENETKGRSIGAGLSFSNEFDYNSLGINFNIGRKTKNKNGEFNAKLQAYIDQVTLIYPIELRTGGNRGDEDDYGTAGRNTFSGSLSWSQIVNRNLQVMLEAEVVYQDGYLGLPFHRVYFNDNSVHVENLPSTRLKIPLGFRASYFLGDKLILKGWYRNYHDQWGINSNAVLLETTIKVTPFFSITPYYRYYQQSAADYFAPFQQHTAADQYYTSNFDLSKFNSNFFGVGFRTAPTEGVFHLQHFNSLEVRYGHYQKTTDLNANIISLNVGFR